MLAALAASTVLFGTGVAAADDTPLTTVGDSTAVPGDAAASITEAPADVTPGADPAEPTPAEPTPSEAPATDPAPATEEVPEATAGEEPAASWEAASPSVFGMGDSLFMQCGDTLGVGTRSLGMVGWPGGTSEDMRVRMSSSRADWPWLTERSHAEELDHFRNASTWVIGLGTNDVLKTSASQFRANVTWFMEQAAGRPVLWFDIYRQNAGQVAAFNQILAEAAAQWPNLRVLDWNGYVTAHPDVLARDGVHVASYAACRSARFALIREALPPVAGQPPSVEGTDADPVSAEPDAALGWVDPEPATPPTPNPVTEAYERSGAEAGPLGAPTGSLSCGHKYDGCVQFFTQGAIAWSPTTGAHTVPAPVAAAWRTYQETGGHGYPTGEATCGADGGCRQRFEAGWMYWSPGTPAYLVNGPILARYRALGGADGALGYPTSASPCGLPGVGCLQHFQGGSIYWSAEGGTRVVTGEIAVRYRALGGPNGRLGYPSADTACVAGGCGQHFAGGSIYWSSPTGAQLVTGGIGARWAALGGPSGPLGYPTSDMLCASSGCGQHFTGGSIYWTPSTGARVSTGEARAR